MRELTNLFDPKEALKDVRKIDSINDNLTKSERLQLRKQKLAEFKKKLANQVVGIMEINEEIKMSAFVEDEIDVLYLQDYLQRMSLEHGLAPWQVQECEIVINELNQQNKLTSQLYKEKFDGKSNEEIFEYLFDVKPVGEVTIDRWSLAPIVICENDNDFNYVKSVLTENNIVMETDHDDTDNSFKFTGWAVHIPKSSKEKRDYFKFNNTLIVVKDQQNGFRGTQKKIIHEKKHIFDYTIQPDLKNDILNNMQKRLSEDLKRLDKIPDEELNNMTKEKFLEVIGQVFKMQISGLVELFEITTKNEILAYCEQGVDVNTIYETLVDSKNGQGYAVIDEHNRKMITDNFLRMMPENDDAEMAHNYLKEALKQGEEKYQKHLYEALNSVAVLSGLSFNKREITSLFQNEPLARWVKIFQRVKLSDKYIELKKRFGNEVPNA